MAYPTVDYKHVGSAAGMQPISETSTTQQHPLGLEVQAKDITYGQGTFIYLKGVASTAKGDLVTYESDTGTTTRAVAGGGASTGACAVAMSACLASQYGWYQVEGAGPVSAATVSDNTALYLTSTAGQVDDTVASGELVDGLRAKAATSGDFATCQINRPNITGSTSTGTNTGDVTLAAVGSTPAAAGASLSAQVLTLQPASATHPGVMTAANFTKVDALAYTYCTLSAGAEGATGANVIRVTGQIKDQTGTNVASATAVYIQSIPVNANTGTMAVVTGTSKKAVNFSENAADIDMRALWMESDATGLFVVDVTNGNVGDNMITATPDNGFAQMLKLTFA